MEKAKLLLTSAEANYFINYPRFKINTPEQLKILYVFNEKIYRKWGSIEKYELAHWKNPSYINLDIYIEEI